MLKRILLATALCCVAFGAQAATTFGGNVASFTASISGTALTVTAVSSGVVSAGEAITSGASSGTRITAGSPCSASNVPCAMTVSASQTVASTSMTAGICHPNITVSGGTTVTAAANISFMWCAATTGKWNASGSGGVGYYYTFTPGANFSSFGPGIAASPYISGGFAVDGGGGFFGGEVYSVGYNQVHSGSIWSQGTEAATGVGGIATGQVGAWAIFFPADTISPPQVWVTPDITGTSGFGGGPLWNGSNTSSPEVPGTGTPVSGGTGVLATMPGGLYFPGLMLSANGDSATFGFSTNTTLDGLIGTGKTYVYKPWDDASGETAPNPGPTNPMTIVIAGAPVYSNSATMTQGNAGTSTPASRILGGPGCNSGGFTSGSDCWVWQALGGGTTSASGDPVATWTCDTPANTGGIYSTSFSGASTETDNGITFACLYKADYPNWTSFEVDTNLNWHTSSGSCTVHDPAIGCYWYWDIVYNHNNGNVYRQINGEFNAGQYLCPSATSGPGPSGTGANISDGSCAWTFVGKLIYSSQAHQLPHWSIPLPLSVAPTSGPNFNTTVLVAYGGHDQQTYQGGQNNEFDPITLEAHIGYIGEGGAGCPNGAASPLPAAPSFPTFSVGSQMFPYGCNGYLSGFTITVKTPPGDSAGVNIFPGTGPLQIDSSKGVTFYNNSAFNGSTGAGDAMFMDDSNVIISGIQFHSVNGFALFGAASGVYPFADDVTLVGNQFLSDAGDGTVTLDAGSLIQNNVFASGSSTSACVGLWLKYVGALVNNTFLGPGSGITNCTAYVVVSSGAGVFDSSGSLAAVPIANNVILNFANPFAYGTALGNTSGAANNATDVSGSFSGGAFTLAFDGATYTSAQMPGIGSSCTPPGNSNSCAGLTASNQLVNPVVGGSLDARVKSTSADIYGAGVGTSFSMSTVGSMYGVTIAPGSDILGTGRPVSGRYDIGAEMFVPGAAPATPHALILGPFGKNEKPSNDNYLRFRLASGG